ncbi:putative rRNA-processing EBP2-like protein [Micractinium conductrix]|uniref:rRNA-processing EBP2-like protein n=1 Tax=Micractinium conductrix TaxID=554055 RepID=A0A2P6VLE2_9CHLO|nr:putative rRNA-processing EBP2-like protein [Micractinium conductrix]|eukprot:PSC74922.1 putative rRNA-processing EBP2-like protein [Micractinium conductrix]
MAMQREQAARGAAAAAAAGSDGEEEEEGGSEQGGAAPAQRQAIYNVEVIHDKLEDISWSEEAAWEESLALTRAAPTAVANPENDLERELAFYNQALDAAQTAIARFEAAGLAWQRPADYYAEMVKSDEHMQKVKEQLLYEKQQIEASDMRKKEREAKKFSKQVAAERKKERAQDKKQAITSISKLRKQREKSGFAGELDVDAELERMEGGGRGGGGRGGRQQQHKPGERFAPRDKSAKREQRDSKFGFGGPKRNRKQNDASSAADGGAAAAEAAAGVAAGAAAGAVEGAAALAVVTAAIAAALVAAAVADVAAAGAAAAGAAAMEGAAQAVFAAAA